VPAHSLSPDQRTELEAHVLALASGKSLDEWRISDLVATSGVSSRTLYKYYPTKEYLLLWAAAQRVQRALGPISEVAMDRGRTAQLRVVLVLQGITRVLTDPATSGGPVMMHALTCGQEAVRPLLGEFVDTITGRVARALAGEREPVAPEAAQAQVIAQVWFAAVVTWAAGVRAEGHIEESVAGALRLLPIGRS